MIGRSLLGVADMNYSRTLTGWYNHAEGAGRMVWNVHGKAKDSFGTACRDEYCIEGVDMTCVCNVARSLPRRSLCSAS